MKQKITNIIGMLEVGVKTDEQTISELLDLFSVSGSVFTKEDLKKAYNNGSRQGSVNGMRVASAILTPYENNLDGEMNVKTFDEWYDEHYC